MAGEAFSLKDAIALYSGKIDLSHKLWAYLQVVAVGAAGFAWGGERPHGVLWLLLGAYIIFALGNGALLVSTQGEAVRIATAVKDYAKGHKNAVEREFVPVLATLNPWARWKVGGVHILIDVGAVAGIAWQLWVQLRVHHGPVGWGEL